ncbi:MAG: HD domain-containing protein [Candidatus Krumholzibacteriaceae bacterium]
MPPNFNTIEKKYAALFERLLARRERIVEFKSFLEKETNWLAEPVFKRAHMDVEHGLLMHSVGVTENALRIKDLIAPDITDESVIVAALFHDVGKLDYPGKPSALPGDNEPPRRGRRHAVRSLELVSRFIPLTEEEAQAIVAHNGLYPLNGGMVNLEYYQKESRLTMILHFADLWTASVEEEGRK